jgi:LPXTG-motif cell wall-anchored protein
MRNTRLLIVAFVAGIITLFSASAAQAYSDEPEIVVPGGGSPEVAPGEEFCISGTFGGAEATSWTATFLGEVIGSGANSTGFEVCGTAPTEAGTYSISFRIVTPDAVAPSASGLTSGFTPVSAIYTKSLSIVVTGDSSGDGDGGDTGAGGAGTGGDGTGALPDTGGSNLLLVAGGAAAVVVGAGLTAARRRRS